MVFICYCKRFERFCEYICRLVQEFEKPIEINAKSTFYWKGGRLSSVEDRFTCLVGLHINRRYQIPCMNLF